jgi:hypothetical protein
MGEKHNMEIESEFSTYHKKCFNCAFLLHRNYTNILFCLQVCRKAQIENRIDARNWGEQKWRITQNCISMSAWLSLAYLALSILINKHIHTVAKTAHRRVLITSWYEATIRERSWKIKSRYCIFHFLEFDIENSSR